VPANAVHPDEAKFFSNQRKAVSPAAAAVQDPKKLFEKNLSELNVGAKLKVMGMVFRLHAAVAYATGLPLHNLGFAYRAARLALPENHSDTIRTVSRLASRMKHVPLSCPDVPAELEQKCEAAWHAIGNALAALRDVGAEVKAGKVNLDEPVEWEAEGDGVVAACVVASEADADLPSLCRSTADISESNPLPAAARVRGTHESGALVQVEAKLGWVSKRADEILQRSVEYAANSTGSDPVLCSKVNELFARFGELSSGLAAKAANDHLDQDAAVKKFEQNKSITKLLAAKVTGLEAGFAKLDSKIGENKENEDLAKLLLVPTLETKLEDLKSRVGGLE
jgi:hypothetical protein